MEENIFTILTCTVFFSVQPNERRKKIHQQYTQISLWLSILWLFFSCIIYYNWNKMGNKFNISMVMYNNIDSSVYNLEISFKYLINFFVQKERKKRKKPTEHRERILLVNLINSIKILLYLECEYWMVLPRFMFWLCPFSLSMDTCSHVILYIVKV